MAADTSSPYDQLRPVRFFFFIALITVVNIGVVTFVYTFWLESPFSEVLAKEKANFNEALSKPLHENMMFTGDSLYDAVFVDTGVEKAAYSHIDDEMIDDATRAVMSLPAMGLILDNVFDYLLLVSYRFGFFTVNISYLICLFFALAFHGAVIRHRKRYGFGDTPLLMNVWARTMLIYSIPITMIIWAFPAALTPTILSLSLAFCVLGVSIFAFSLPKIA
jgi:hypothetical protein